MDIQFYIDALLQDKLSMYFLPVYFVAVGIEVYLAYESQKELYETKDTINLSSIKKVILD